MVIGHWTLDNGQWTLGGVSNSCGEKLKWQIDRYISSYLLLLKKLLFISLPESRRHINRINLLLFLYDVINSVWFENAKYDWHKCLGKIQNRQNIHWPYWGWILRVGQRYFTWWTRIIYKAFLLFQILNTRISDTTYWTCLVIVSI